MRRKLIPALLLLLALLALTACETAVPEATVPVERITLSDSAVALSVRCVPTIRLYATVHPADATVPQVTFTSSDPKVAQVDESGTVTALAPGEAEIRVTSADASGVTAVMKVTVLPDSQQIRLEVEEASLFPGEAVSLGASLYPLNAYDWSIQYSSSNSSIAAVSEDGLIRAVSPGIAEITVAPGDGNCPSRTVTVEVKKPIPDGFHLIDGDLYYYEKNVPLTNTTMGPWAFGGDGRYTSGLPELDAVIRELILSETDDSMTLLERFETLYDWVIANSKYLRRDYIDPGATGWEPEPALQMLTSHRGNCFSYAAAVTMIARHLGFEAYGISGHCRTGPTNNPLHGWTEVILDGVTYICDAEMEGIFSANRKLGWDLFMRESGTTPTKYTYSPTPN